MKTNKDIALLFSEGKFELASIHLSSVAEWHIYEDDRHLSGKDAIMAFAAGISRYFDSTDTEFNTHGILNTGNRIAVYGYAEFKLNGKLFSAVNLCDVYEFDDKGCIVTIHSYWNSTKE